MQDYPITRLAGDRLLLGLAKFYIDFWSDFPESHLIRLAVQYDPSFF